MLVAATARSPSTSARRGAAETRSLEVRCERSMACGRKTATCSYKTCSRPTPTQRLDRSGRTVGLGRRGFRLRQPFFLGLALVHVALRVAERRERTEERGDADDDHADDAVDQRHVAGG